MQGLGDDATRWTVVVDGPRKWLIATVENGQPGDTLDTERETAHAIAALPVLLPALEQMVADHPCGYAKGFCTGCATCVAEAAIAKAKGGAA
ncbi:MAG: hypothetical protein Q8L86_10225 [Vicinamibacterales bacterium]|nr:hypothetical protein [Vicinamibacterales bacterium]